MKNPSIIQAAAMILLCLLADGCSPRQTPTQVPEQTQREDVQKFADGSVMRVRKRTGDSLEGVIITRKSPAGLEEKYEADRGKISKGVDSQVVRVVLYEAKVDRGLEGKMVVGELSMDFLQQR